MTTRYAQDFYPTYSLQLDVDKLPNWVKQSVIIPDNSVFEEEFTDIEVSDYADDVETCVENFQDSIAKKIKQINNPCLFDDDGDLNVDGELMFSDDWPVKICHLNDWGRLENVARDSFNKHDFNTFDSIGEGLSQTGTKYEISMFYRFITPDNSNCTNIEEWSSLDDFKRYLIEERVPEFLRTYIDEERLANDLLVNTDYIEDDETGIVISC